MFEQFLGVKDTSQLFRTEQEFRRVAALQFTLASFPLNVDNIGLIPDYLDELDESLDVLEDLLAMVERVLDNTIT